MSKTHRTDRDWGVRWGEGSEMRMWGGARCSSQRIYGGKVPGESCWAMSAGTMFSVWLGRSKRKESSKGREAWAGLEMVGIWDWSWGRQREAEKGSMLS